MRVTFPERPTPVWDQEPPPQLLYGSVTTFSLTDEPKKRKKRKKAPLGFRPVKVKGKRW